MNNQSILGKILRILAVILLGLTAVFHLLGGVGTTCVALGAEKYDSMVGLVDYKWLYILFVLVTIAIGIFGIRATIHLARSYPHAYRESMIILVIGLLVAGVHMAASEILRGASAPANMRVYLNIFTLIFFLLLRLPPLWKRVGFGSPSVVTGGGAAAGIAAILAGITTLTVHLWAGPTHTWGGINFADVWHGPMTVIGWLLIVVGIVLVTRGVVTSAYQAATMTDTHLKPVA